MKKWYGIEKLVDKEINIPKDLWQYEEAMREIPNHNNKQQGARKIFQRKEYSIYKVSDGYIVHNTNKEFRIGHTHVRSFKKAKSILDLCVRKKLPNTPRTWEIESLMRVTNNQTYRNKLRDLYQTLL